MMLMRLVVVVSLALAISACGTKSNLLKPNGDPTPKTQKDPSQPPNPISR
jgi:predicted small lipoprotein YifL